MVRKEGQENGIGVWNIEGYSKIYDRIVSRIESVDSDFEISEIIVMGSYGAGYGVPGKSDLDVVVFGIFNAPIGESELSVWQSRLAEKVMSAPILDGFSEINGLDLYVDDPAHKTQALRQYWAYEPVEKYYDLSADEIQKYDEL